MNWGVGFTGWQRLVSGVESRTRMVKTGRNV